MSLNDEIQEPFHLQLTLQESIGKKVQVINCITSSLLPKGENFGSLILKLETTIKRSRDSPEEKLYLIAKILPLSELYNSRADLTLSFAKEIFVYEKLLTYYKQIEEDAGIKSENIINFLPKYYGSRLSVNKKTGKAEKGTYMIMENLKERNYYIADRKKGLDLDHTTLVIKELARFHALGIALKSKKPVYFEKAKQILKYPFDTSLDTTDLVNNIINSIFVDSRLAMYEERIRSCLSVKNLNVIEKVECKEPWISLYHNDLWLNNIMFHKGEHEVDDVKFIDFPIMAIGSPMRDLPLFLCGSTDYDVIDNHFDNLLDIYYDNFIDELEKTNCNTAPFSRANFDKQMKIDAQNELFHCLLSLKCILTEESDNVDMDDLVGSVFLSDSNNLYKERVWKIISKYIEKQWI